jgi:hypothetical protein
MTVDLNFPDEALIAEFSSVAEALSVECNIPGAHFFALLRTLKLAKEHYAAGKARDDLFARLHSGDNLKKVTKFVKAGLIAYNAWADLDNETKQDLLQVPELDHEGMITVYAGAHFCDSMIPRGRRGKPLNTALYFFVLELFNFWGTYVWLSSFYPYFEDYEDPECDPLEVTWRPLNDLSRFVVGAAKTLIKEPVSGATCKAMMERVLAGPPKTAGLRPGHVSGDALPK